MRSEVGRRAPALVLVAGLGALLAGCTVGYEHVGNPLRGVPHDAIVRVVTPRADVLRIFGPPDRLIREPGGYAYIYESRFTESRSLTVREPVLLRTDLYSWSETDERSDRLLITFDESGRVLEWGIRRGIDEPRR